MSFFFLSFLLITLLEQLCTSITYQLRYVYTYDGADVMLLLRNWKLIIGENEITRFVIDFSLKSSICVNIEEKIKVISSPSCISSIVNFKFTGIDEMQVLTGWFRERKSSIYLKVKLKYFTRFFFFLSFRRFWISSASCGYKNKSVRWGAQLVPIGIPTVNWNTKHPNSTNCRLKSVELR